MSQQLDQQLGALVSVCSVDDCRPSMSLGSLGPTPSPVL